MMTFEMFQPQIDYLSSDYLVIGYNNRTWFRPEEPHTLDDLVEDCRNLLDELKIRRCVLFGMSMGGHMAISFALKYPERLDGLVLMGAGAAAFPPEIQEITGESFAQLDIEGQVPREWAERTARVVFGETTFADNRVLIDHWIEQWTRAPARVVYRQGMSWIYKEDLSRRDRRDWASRPDHPRWGREGLPHGVGPSDAGGPSRCEIGPDTTGRTLCKPRESRCGQ